MIVCSLLIINSPMDKIKETHTNICKIKSLRLIKYNRRRDRKTKI